MFKKKIKNLLGLGVIIVIICGVAFFFVRGKQPEVVEEPIQQESLFINEDTVTDPSLVEVERHWEEVVPSEEMTLGAITDTYLHSEPFSDSDTVIKVPMKAEFVEEATCFTGNEPLNFSKVTYNGVTGYIDLLDTEYVVEVAESINIEVAEDVEGVSQESIVDVAEEEQTEETAEAEPTPEAVQEEAPVVEATPAPSTEPVVEPTVKPNVTVKSEADKQAELQAEALKRLEALGVAESPTSTEGMGTTVGTGKHYGDAQ